MTKIKTKISSGESFLYRRVGTESQVCEIRLKGTVNMSALQEALRKTYERYPYFNTKFKEVNGQMFLVSNPTRPIAALRKRPRKLSSAATNYNLLDLTVYRNSIFVSFHHAVCDGRGILPFVKTLLYQYFIYIQPFRKYRVPDLRVPGENLLDGEMADPVESGNFDFDPAKVTRVDRTGYALPEVLGGTGQGGKSYRFELVFGSGNVMGVCKEYGCSPSVLFCIMMQRAVRYVHPEADKPIVANVICDWRQAIGLPNTFRNCVTSVYLPYDETRASLSDKELGCHFRELLDAQRTIDSARASASVIKALSDMLSDMSSYEQKQQMMEKVAGAEVNTFVMSYLGLFDMGDLNDEIESMQIYTSGDRGLTVEVVALKDKFTMNVKQSFGSQDYVDAFLMECNEAGIVPLAVSEKIEFQVPKDGFTQYPLWQVVYDKLKEKVLPAV